MPGPAPTIVIFGAGVLAGGAPSRTLRARVEAAFASGGPDALYVVTGAIGRHPPSEARVMADLLAGMGVPAAHVTLEETSHDTMASVLACAPLVAGAGGVRIATSGYHLPRCWVLMRLAGVAVTCCPPPHPPLWPWYWRLRECAALPYDAALMIAHRTRNVFQRWMGSANKGIRP